MSRWLRLLVLCGLTLSAACAGEPAPGYELHEWGVFPVPRNSAWAMRALRGEWATFPKFFRRVWPEENLPYYGPVSKPVVWLHAPKPFRVELKIRFATGRPLVWWPDAASPARGIGEAQRDTLHFLLGVGHPNPKAPKGEPETVPPEVPAGHWMETLRRVASTAVYAPADNVMFQRAPKDAFHAEKFIYYDGLMKAPATPGIERDGEAVVLATNFGFPLHDLVALERDEKGLRLPAEPLETLPAGERKTRVELKPCAKADEAAAIARLEKTLAERLAAAGLHADEARALIEVWRPGLWQRPGLTVFYRVPQEVYESWLPLAAQPAPAKTVRVGVVLHECLEPELEARVEALIKALGAEGFEDREDARKALLEIGGAVFPQLEAHAKGKDEQIAQSCRDILAALDVLPALSEPPAKKP